MVGVAQLVRASGCGPEGRGFKSHHSPSKKVSALWCNWLTHRPFKAESTGSSPVRVTKPLYYLEAFFMSCCKTLFTSVGKVFLCNSFSVY